MTMINRRGFLKTSGGTIVGSSAIEKFLAGIPSSNLSLEMGRTHLCEVYLQHEAEFHQDYHTDGGNPPHILHDDGNRVAVCEASVGQFRRNFAATFRRRYYDKGGSPNSNQRAWLRLQTGPHSCFTRSAMLAQDYNPPEWTVNKGNGNRAILETPSGIEKVGPNKSTDISLDERWVVKSGKKRAIRPVLTIKNHGVVEVYGKPNSMVFPRKTEDPWVNHRILNYVSASDTDRISVEKTDNYVVVEQT